VGAPINVPPGGHEDGTGVGDGAVAAVGERDAATLHMAAAGGVEERMDRGRGGQRRGWWRLPPSRWRR